MYIYICLFIYSVPWGGITDLFEQLHRRSCSKISMLVVRTLPITIISLPRFGTPQRAAP